MSKKTLLFAFWFLYSSALFPQDTLPFTEGLMLNSILRYGREAVVQDEVAYRLFKGNFDPPAEGDIFKTTEAGIAWKKVLIDSSGSFVGEDLSEGYLYLSYESNAEKEALLNIAGHAMVFVNGVPRGGDIYRSGWMHLPVQLRKGRNDILIRGSRWMRWQGIEAKLIFPDKPIALNTDDPTLPFVVVGENDGELTGAIVVINASSRTLNNLSIVSVIEGKQTSRSLPSIPPFAIRKVAFAFHAGQIDQKGRYSCTLQLKDKKAVIDEKQVQIDAVNPDDHYSATFISDIDGSVQYYGVTPQAGGMKEGSSLFLSVHGAGVEAIGQARAYDPKDWGTLVAPTNRRPRGFNWEDWGRLDALEVLEIAKNKFNPDPKRIYLTGHSMGGHGTWYLGATYPGKWAAIAPCAGYPTLKAYGSADGIIPKEGESQMDRILAQGSSPSDVLELAPNLKASGIYIHHGDSDKVVSVDFARQMRKLLADFHPDFSYYEYPGGSHWFGDESVDWPPLFGYFKWHTIAPDSAINDIDFTTASPAISSAYSWAHILQQQRAFQYSRLQLHRSIAGSTIQGTTKNVAAIGLSLKGFQLGDTVSILLDGNDPVYHMISAKDDFLCLYKKDRWEAGEKPAARMKGVIRNGSFREPFNHRMVYVYGSSGSKEESSANYNKARYDAEVWYYRGNGAVDIITDKAFDPAKYPDRGVILYGNASNNSAWKKLLSGCPVQVNRGSITAGNRIYEGDDLGAYFMWPRPDSETASVAVISGTGLTGMRATEANQYFAAGSGFPDFFVFSVDILKEGVKGIRCAGFYDNEWKIDPGNTAFNE